VSPLESGLKEVVASLHLYSCRSPRFFDKPPKLFLESLEPAPKGTTCADKVGSNGNLLPTYSLIADLDHVSEGGP
jgi:hypothetical protein